MLFFFADDDAELEAERGRVAVVVDEVGVVVCRLFVPGVTCRLLDVGVVSVQARRFFAAEAAVVAGVGTMADRETTTRLVEMRGEELVVSCCTFVLCVLARSFTTRKKKMRAHQQQQSTTTRKPREKQ